MLKGGQAQARRCWAWVRVDRGRVWRRGLKVKDASGGVEAQERSLPLWEHRGGRGEPKTLEPTEKGTAKGEEGSHDLPRVSAEDL
jgi:hypothetical protein